MFEDVLRFWLDRGVDGFRIDVAHGLFKEAGLRDQLPKKAAPDRRGQHGRAHQGGDEPMWDQPEVHEVYRRWHKVLAEYDGDRMAVGRGLDVDRRVDGGLRPPRRAQPGVQLLLAARPWSAAGFAQVITGTLDAVEPVGASPTWVLSNHDVIRHVTRYGGGARGLARAERATPPPCHDAGAARVGVCLPGRGARPRAGRRRPEFRQDPILASGPARRAATAAGCRSRGGARSRRTASGRAPPSRGSPSRTTGRR